MKKLILFYSVIDFENSTCLLPDDMVDYHCCEIVMVLCYMGIKNI